LSSTLLTNPRNPPDFFIHGLHGFRGLKRQHKDAKPQSQEESDPDERLSTLIKKLFGGRNDRLPWMMFFHRRLFACIGGFASANP